MRRCGILTEFKLYHAQEVQLAKSQPTYYYVMKMGTGKTVMGLSHVKKWFPSSDVLVIAPKQVVKAKSWEQDAELVGLKNNLRVITTDGVKKLTNGDVTHKFVIVDEAHKFKNKSARSNQLLKLLKFARGFIFLSGTPTNGKFDDLEMYSLYFGHVRTHTQFKNLYKVVEAPYWSKYPIWRVGKNTDRLSSWFKSITSDVVTLDDIKELPPIYESVVDFNADSNYRKTRMSYSKDDKIIFNNHVERRIYQRQNQNNKAKVEWLKELAEEYAQDKAIIFYNFNTERDLLDQTLKDYKVGHVNGNEYNPKGDFVLIQISSGAGLTLNDFKHAVWWSLPDSFIDFDQSKYRNYRIGQESKITRDYLIVHGTIDDQIKYALDQKKDFNEEMFDD
ncbi:DNA helicase, phage-associated [Ligilactobacillus acidipiscis]|uniref:DNA helicase, phage-associated n=3 Tax=Ligilactobacillus acidipiscis TaxID=89059 RepID=A0A1K1KQQ3_9LACO|nr:DNA helicase, phage-associated [Ligilactobacillus acidipiscis]